MLASNVYFFLVALLYFKCCFSIRFVHDSLVIRQYSVPLFIIAIRREEKDDDDDDDDNDDDDDDGDGLGQTNTKTTYLHLHLQ